MTEHNQGDKNAPQSKFFSSVIGALTPALAGCGYLAVQTENYYQIPLLIPTMVLPMFIVTQTANSFRFNFKSAFKGAVLGAAITGGAIFALEKDLRLLMLRVLNGNKANQQYPRSRDYLKVTPPQHSQSAPAQQSLF